MQWFVYSGGQQSGPFTWEALLEHVREGRLAPTDHVWTPSLGDQWAEARSVPGLFSPPAMTGAQTAPDAEPQPADEAALPSRPSCTAAVGPAWARMKEILFRPFDLGKWFVLGFSAWLATLGDFGIGSASGSSGGETLGRDGFGQEEWQLMREGLTQTLQNHLSLVLTIAAVVVVAALLVAAVILWVRARGKFMFLDNVVHNRIEIAAPWCTYRVQAWSFFWWTLGYSLVCLLINVLLLIFGVVSILRPWWTTGTVAGLWPLIVGNGALWFGVICVTGFISRYLEDFILPLMYNERISATEAWGRFLALFGEHAGALVVYGLFYGVVLKGLAVLAVLLLIVCTCCLAGCLLFIPYVGTVLLLPALVFLRSYSLAYLAQFGPQYRMRRTQTRA